VGPWALTLLLVAAVWPATWGGITGLTFVQGHSMEPTYYTGDLVLTIRQPAYEVGDVISFQVPPGQAGEGGRAIHRISAVGTLDGAEAYVTLGDNNAEADPWLTPSRHIMGRAVAHVPKVGLLLGSSLQRTLLAGAAALVVLALLWPSRAPTPDTEPAA